MNDFMKDTLERLQKKETKTHRLVTIDVLLEESSCQYPSCPDKGETYRQNTLYEDELMNIVCYCPYHKEQNDMLWEEHWAEYRSGLL